jgi:hypothetical protein
LEKEIEVIKQAYGDSSLDDFYPWLREHYNDFVIDDAFDITTGFKNTEYDMTGYPPINPYPSFWANGKNEFSLCSWSIRYQDLYINISEAVNYLKIYKQRNVDDLRICLSNPATVQLFDAEGCLIAQTTDRVIPLKGVAYIKLVGNGFMGNIEIVGYYKESVQFTSETVLHTAVPDDNSDNSVSSWSYITIINNRNLEYELLFRDDITVIARMTGPCTAIIRDLSWEEQTYTGVSEITLSNTRSLKIFNFNPYPVTLEIVVIPKS